MGSSDLKAESFHLLGFLLSYCISLWDMSGKISELLNEVILLIGYFAVLHPKNQSILHWGKSPTIIEKLCQLPFNYFIDRKLQTVLNPTLLSACFRNARNREVTERNVSLKFVLQFIKRTQEREREEEEEKEKEKEGKEGKEAKEGKKGKAAEPESAKGSHGKAPVFREGSHFALERRFPRELWSDANAWMSSD